MEKEIKLEAEKIESFRAELQIVMDELRAARAGGGTPKVSKLKSENETMKKILGGFHPASDSLTYKELYDENQELKKKTKELLTENTKLKQGIANRESEIQLLRSSNIPQEASTSVSSAIEGPEGARRESCLQDSFFVSYLHTFILFQFAKKTFSMIYYL